MADLVLDVRYGEKMDVKDFPIITEDVRDLAELPIMDALAKVYKVVYPVDSSGKADDSHMTSTFAKRKIYGFETFRNVKRNYTDFWQFPFETLLYNMGDCEDTAILTGALLRAKETEYYVVVGRVKKGGQLLGYHAWLHGKFDQGWVLVETTLDQPPMVYTQLSQPMQKVIQYDDLTYESCFFFNHNEVVILEDIRIGGNSRNQETNKMVEVKKSWQTKH